MWTSKSVWQHRLKSFSLSTISMFLRINVISGMWNLIFLFYSLLRNFINSSRKYLLPPVLLAGQDLCNMCALNVSWSNGTVSRSVENRIYGSK